MFKYTRKELLQMLLNNKIIVDVVTQNVYFYQDDFCNPFRKTRTDKLNESSVALDTFNDLSLFGTFEILSLQKFQKKYEKRKK